MNFSILIQARIKNVKSSRILAVKNHDDYDYDYDYDYYDCFSIFLGFKQESKKVKLQFLISIGSQTLAFEPQIRAKIEIF